MPKVISNFPAAAKPPLAGGTGPIPVATNGQASGGVARPSQAANPPTLAKPEPAVPRPTAVIYPDLCVNGVAIPRANLRITVAMARALLGWEDEGAYAERLQREKGSISKERFYYVSSGGENPDKAPEFLFKDVAGHKVVCTSNCGNREFNLPHCMSLAQDILNRRWRFNCETIIIGKTGLVISAQHRLIALVLAAQIWDGVDSDKWRAKWPEQPYIEALVATGAEEDDETVRTIDNVMPRSLKDVISTSPVFADLRPQAKRECSRMMSRATDILWQRTGAGHKVNGAVTYKTHSVEMDFIANHPRLADCVRHMHNENTGEGRAISNLELSPGEASAMLYLMGSSGTAGIEYRNVPTPMDRTEATMNWDRWDRAKEFWFMLAADKPSMTPLRNALQFVHPDTGKRKHNGEKHAILAKAWGHYLAKTKLDPELDAHQGISKSLCLQYEKELNDDGSLKNMWLDECPVFGGIDVGIAIERRSADDPEELTPARSKELLRQAKDKEVAETISGSKAKGKGDQAPKPTKPKELTPAQWMDQFHAQHPGKILLFSNPQGGWYAYGGDASAVSQVVAIEPNDNVDPIRLCIRREDAAAAMPKLAASPLDVVMLTLGADQKMAATALPRTAASVEVTMPDGGPAPEEELLVPVAPAAPATQAPAAPAIATPKPKKKVARK